MIPHFVKAKAVETIPNALQMVEESLRWGDSDYHSNSVRVGYNQAIEIIADRLNALPVSKEKEVWKKLELSWRCRFLYYPLFLEEYMRRLVANTVQ